MRPRRIPAGLAGVTGVIGLLATGSCGDDGDGLSAFCEGVQEVDADFEDRGDDAEVVTEQAEQLAQLDPPQRIAEDWDVFVEGMPEFFNPEALEGGEGDLEAAQDFSERSERWQRAVRSVSAYLRDECRLEG